MRKLFTGVQIRNKLLGHLRGCWKGVATLLASIRYNILAMPISCGVGIACAGGVGAWEVKIAGMVRRVGFVNIMTHRS